VAVEDGGLARIAMRVAVNGFFCGREGTGSGQYIGSLLGALLEWDDITEYVVVLCQRPASSARFGCSSSSRPFDTVRCRTPFDGLNDNLAKLWFEQIGFPRACRKAGASLAFVPYFAPPFFCPVPVVVTIHDLIPLILPQYRGSAGVRMYMRLVAASARRADVILADSESSHGDIVRRLGIPTDRIRVVHLAVDDAYHRIEDEERLARVRERYGLPARYLLYFGGFDVRKGVREVVTAYARVAELTGFPEDVGLVIAGRLPTADTSFTPDPRVVADALAVGKGIVFTGWVDERDKPALYSGAMAFLFPSEYEGFGLPPLEALSCGVPVITSNVSSLPEVVGAAAVLVSPSDVDGLATAILNLVQDETLRERMGRASLAQAEEFTWSRVARETHASFTAATRTS